MTALPYYLGLTVIKMLSDNGVLDDPKLNTYDTVGKIWSKSWLAMTLSYPEIVNKAKADVVDGGCLIVANHASWLDIPVICTALDGPFKFIAKGEVRQGSASLPASSRNPYTPHSHERYPPQLTKVPLIGQQLTGGDHVLITRDDRRSQLATFKAGVKYLSTGTPIMAFPEGQRSKSGRLEPFKGGVFSMAMKAKVPVLPITICNSHAVMPSTAMFPVQAGEQKLRVVVHDVVPYEEGRTEQVRAPPMSQRRAMTRILT